MRSYVCDIYEFKMGESYMSKITIKKERLRWLFGGVGFHNSEATMTPLMSEKFKNEVVVKTFREISPTFSRLFAGYSNWTREAMDEFADYYDKTFRKSGTLLYVVPGRLPYITDDFDMEKYCESVASNLEYLIKERNCTKIRYYCVTNELSVGNTYAWFANHLDLFKEFHKCLYKAFKRHNLDIGLMATDCSGVENFGQIEWATKNMDEVTEMYCAHLYSMKFYPGDLKAYQYYVDSFTPVVLQAHKREKRFVLGEYGIVNPNRLSKMPMRNDVSYCEDEPEIDNIYAMALCEMAMASVNCGSFASAMWTLFDYPDPFIREDGDTPQEKAKYDVARFSGHGLDIRYNKNGLIRWCDEENDYSSRAALYTMGYMAKFFKKGSRVLKSEWDDELLRCCAVTNPDGSVSVAVMNWDETEKTVSFELEHTTDKPLRKYEYKADSVPYNKFNDLQECSGIVELSNMKGELVLNPRSVTFLTTDYKERVPSEIKNIVLKGDRLLWDKCEDEEHCYYRVYAGDEKDFIPAYENQIASTVAEYVNISEKKKYYKVRSVDKSGNV